MDSFSAIAGLNLRGYVLAQIAIFVASLVFVRPVWYLCLQSKFFFYLFFVLNQCLVIFCLF